jgi:CHAD domain-containing protein
MSSFDDIPLAPSSPNPEVAPTMIDGDLSASTLGERSRRPRDANTDPLGAHSQNLQRLIKDVGDKPKPGAVHHLRTTIRRFETLLPEPSGSGGRLEKKVQKQLDRIRKRAGKLRDVDVQLRALRSLHRSHQGEEYSCVLRVLHKARSKGRKRLADTLAETRDRGLLKRLRRVVGRAAGLASATPQEPLELPGVLDRFAELARTTGSLTEANLHEFRKQTKRVRYLAETIETPEATTAVAQLKRIQDAIGSWHDWLVLSGRTAKVLEVDTSSALLRAMQERTATQLEKALATTTAASRRLNDLRRHGPRKAARPLARMADVPRSVGASA